MPTIRVRIEYEDGSYYEMWRNIPIEDWDALHTPGGYLKPEFDLADRKYSATAPGRLVTAATHAMDSWIDVAWKMKDTASKWRDDE